MKILRLVMMLICSASTVLYAQDDLLGELSKQDSAQTIPVTATFKSTRVVNGQSVETMKKKHLDFRISHRFGKLNSGAYQFFGLDQATMRMGFEYGLTDDFEIGVGRSTSQKVYDFFGKYKVLKQSSGARTIPVSVTLFGGMGIGTVNKELEFQDKLYYTAQVLIARKFGERLSLQLSPTYLYRNHPEVTGDEKLLLAVGIGGRFKLSKRVSLNGEYFYTAREKNTVNAPYYDSMSFGVDIETGGHVFQLHFTNSLGMIEKQFIGETAGTWGKGDIHYGFNISRTFSFDKKNKKKPTHE
jgi:opacity protein-like surface antigen